MIELLNPLAVLLRGYSITYSGDKVLMSAGDVREGDKIRIRLSDGSIEAAVEGVQKDK